MTVYLLHFETKYKHAGHYLGSTVNLQRRLEEHRNGTGARLLAVIGAAGIGWELARVWENGDYELEKQLKRRHNGRKLCPICQAKIRRKG